jgi:hypothetical protein
MPRRILGIRLLLIMVELGCADIGVAGELLDLLERPVKRPPRYRTTRLLTKSLGLMSRLYWSWQHGASNAITRLKEEINAKSRGQSKVS